MTEYFEIGKVVKPQGVRGEVKAELFTDDPERIAELPFVLLGNPPDFVKRTVRKARTDGKFAYLTLEGITDRDAAEKLRGALLYVDRAHAAPLPEGAFYIQDLVGLPVETEGGEHLGTLREILQTGAKDIYVVDLAKGGTLMFPSVEDVFETRDPEGGKIVLRSARLGEIGEYAL